MINPSSVCLCRISIVQSKVSDKTWVGGGKDGAGINRVSGKNRCCQRLAMSTIASCCCLTKALPSRRVEWIQQFSSFCCDRVRSSVLVCGPALACLSVCVCTCWLLLKYSTRDRNRFPNQTTTTTLQKINRNTSISSYRCIRHSRSKDQSRKINLSTKTTVRPIWFSSTPLGRLLGRSSWHDRFIDAASYSPSWRCRRLRSIEREIEKESRSKGGRNSQTRKAIVAGPDWPVKNEDQLLQFVLDHQCRIVHNMLDSYQFDYGRPTTASRCCSTRIESFQSCRPFSDNRNAGIGTLSDISDLQFSLWTFEQHSPFIFFFFFLYVFVFNFFIGIGRDGPFGRFLPTRKAGQIRFASVESSASGRAGS